MKVQLLPIPTNKVERNQHSGISYSTYERHYYHPTIQENESPIFAQRKTKGKLRLFIALGKIKNLISDAYLNNIHPVSTLADAAQHVTGKNLICKLNCSTAYKGQTTDYWKYLRLISPVEPSQIED